MEPNEKHVVPQIGQESQTVIVIFDHPMKRKLEYMVKRKDGIHGIATFRLQAAKPIKLRSACDFKQIQSPILHTSPVRSRNHDQ